MSQYYDDHDGLHRNPFSDGDETPPPANESVHDPLEDAQPQDVYGGPSHGDQTDGNGNEVYEPAQDNHSQSESQSDNHSHSHSRNQDHADGAPYQQPVNNENTDPEDRPLSSSPHSSPHAGPQSQSQSQSQGPPVPAKERKEPKMYKIIVEVTAVERSGKKDPIIKFNAYTNLPSFRTTRFRDVRRTHHEFVRFFEHLNGANPECFVPAVPKSSSSAGAGTEEDDAKVKARMQTWFDRVSRNPILARDAEFVHFIQADFGYAPVVKGRPPATGLARKAMKQLAPPPDDVEELQQLRPKIKHVYLLTSDAAHKLDRLTKHRRSLGLALGEFSQRCGAMAVQQQGQGHGHGHGPSHDFVISNRANASANANMWRKFCRAVATQGDLCAVQATSEAVSLEDGLGLVAANAYVAKEALTNRHLLIRELLKAQKESRSRHQTASKVRASTSISPARADEALAALEEATKAEEALTGKVRRVSENMLYEKEQMIKYMEQDLRSYIAEYALRTIECERRSLTAWENIRVDVRAADSLGGLSRLGRDSHNPSARMARKAPLVHSQGASGDAWSGDRLRRASDLRSSADIASPSVEASLEFERRRSSHDNLGGTPEPETAVDARNAASLLAGSTF